MKKNANKFIYKSTVKKDKKQKTENIVEWY